MFRGSNRHPDGGPTVSDVRSGVARAPLPLQTERIVFAVTGAVSTFVALLVNGLLVAMSRLEGSQFSDPHASAKTLYLRACLVAVVLAIGAAALTRRRPHLASLLGGAAVVLGTVAAVAIADALGFRGRDEAKVMLLAIWLFLTSPLDVAVVMGLLPRSAEPAPAWGPRIALIYVGLSVVVLLIVVFPLQNGMVAMGALIVWLLLTSAITVLGVRGTLAPGRPK